MNQLSNNEFIFRKSEGIYYLKNVINVGDTVLSYELLITSCSTNQEELVEQGVVQQNEEVIINIESDDVYKLKITGIEEYVLTIHHFPCLFSSVLKDIEKILCTDCECGCSDDCVPKEIKDCVEYQRIFNNILTLKSLVKPIANDTVSVSTINNFIDEAVNYYKCYILSDFYNQQLSLSIEGQASFNASLFRKLVSIYYIALYKYDLLLAETEEEINYVNSYYNYSIISKCVSKAGVSLCDLFDLFDELVVTNNTPPTIDSNIIQLTPTINGQNYEASYNFLEIDLTTNFADLEGDNPNKIQIVTLPIVGELLFNNNPVTIGFIFDYLEIGNLQYSLSINGQSVFSVPFNDIFFFKVSDDNTNSLYSINTMFTFEILSPTELPASCVDDVEFNIIEGQVLTLTDAPFIAAFTDPNGDSIGSIKIIFNVDNSPIVFKNNGIVITTGQEITLADITNGNITAETIGNVQNIPSINFEYQASDSGTGIFISTCNI